MFLKVVRDMNEYLLLFNRAKQQDEGRTLINARSVFNEKAGKFVFTSEVPSEGQVQVLDLRLTISKHQGRLPDSALSVRVLGA